MHELLHALGQEHEQSRPDRDKYIKVNLDKIQAGFANNFEIVSKGDMQRAYDMLSLMHYEADAFSVDKTPTISVKPPAYALYTTDPNQYHK